jgi:hypothetical protein
MAEALDKEKGSTVTDASIYRAHAAKYEVREAGKGRGRWGRRVGVEP